MKVTITITLLIISSSVFSQTNVFLGQYFNVAPIFAPGLVGANDFLDIRTGSKYQWIGYEGAPTSYFISASNSFTIGKANPYKFNSVRVSNMAPYTTKGLKFGLGGYVLNDSYGEYHQTEAVPTFTIHIPVSSRSYFSLGVSTGFYHSRIGSGVSVLDPSNDLTYQIFKANGSRSGYLKINTGIALYSNNYYFGYSLVNASTVLLNSNVHLEEFDPDMTHHLLGGVAISLSQKVEFIQSALMRLSPSSPMILDIGMKVRYMQNPYFGLSYRNDKSFLALFGFTIKDLLGFSYAYDFKSLQDATLNSSSHEIMLSLRLFNYGKYVPIW